MPRRFVFRHQNAACMPCWLKAALGTVISLGIISLLDDMGGAPLLAAPLGASAMLVFGMPESPMSQPANVVGGHVIATLIGLAFDHFLPGGWAMMALSVATVMVTLAALRLTHPPAGGDPLVIMMAHPGWGFLLMPVLLGAVILVVVAVLIHRLPPRAAYPLPIHPPAET
ncbi:HPP family protein [Paramagnetospirillum kuznetsovii]|uniref:HPP family protein n=1 Tax=Paramagnetospirillum kuznetsovii TaxID=2053833 RepID=A0A364P3M8_9PROT|nr:HPP family protein [Paramagnetospirillum kuznetsovii]RAU23890.1 HPP family protein [Paramagnetospirillum kuznetsovii]